LLAHCHYVAKPLKVQYTAKLARQSPATFHKFQSSTNEYDRVIPVLTTKHYAMKAYVGVHVQIDALFASALAGGRAS
jgi:hypothetical protein